MRWPPRIVRTASSNVPLAARPSVSVEPAIRTVTTFITSPGSQGPGGPCVAEAAAGALPAAVGPVDEGRDVV